MPLSLLLCCRYWMLRHIFCCPVKVLPHSTFTSYIVYVITFDFIKRTFLLRHKTFLVMPYYLFVVLRSLFLYHVPCCYSIFSIKSRNLLWHSIRHVFVVMLVYALSSGYVC
uniref:Uncharacterized protein n=1 Tax=Octopus bimaculoides TaxID=37653 RepID=A0A0L8GW51_OCTBM